MLTMLTGVALLAGVPAQSAWAGHAPSGQAIEIRLTCKQVASCEDAVRLWCGGYRRADADRDGIPCENVCSSLDEVQALQDAIGCR